MAKQAAPPSPPAYSISGFSFKCAGALHSLRGEIYNLNNTKHSTAQTRRKRKKQARRKRKKKKKKPPKTSVLPNCLRQLQDLSQRSPYHPPLLRK
jgi:hypothetical protein